VPITVYVIEIIVSYKIEKIQISNGVKTTTWNVTAFDRAYIFDNDNLKQPT